jgi:nitroreductase
MSDWYSRVRHDCCEVSRRGGQNREAGVNPAPARRGDREPPHTRERASIGRTAGKVGGPVCLAIQNLWLVATAERLGVGWVSFYREPSLRDLVPAEKGICAGRVPF